MLFTLMYICYYKADSGCDPKYNKYNIPIF